MFAKAFDAAVGAAAAGFIILAFLLAVAVVLWLILRRM